MAREQRGSPTTWPSAGVFGIPVSPSPTQNTSYGFSFHDVDRDGDLDIGWAGLDADSTGWAENTSGDMSSAASPQDVAGPGGSVDAIAVHFADLDGDGDLDAIARNELATDPQVQWWENDNGDQTSWTEHSIAANAACHFSLCWLETADLDRDGDLDVIAGAQGGAVIYENTGVTDAWPSTSLTAAGVGAGAITADIDGDGDPDLLAASGDSIGWLENLSIGPAGSVSTTPVTTSSTSGDPTDVQAMDVDRDGDLDLVYAENSTGAVRWFNNSNGDGTYWGGPSIVALGGFIDLTKLAQGDFDGDGQTDVVTLDSGAGSIDLFTNIEGLFSPAVVGTWGRVR